MKKVLFTFIAIIFLLLGAVIALPYFFKDRIIAEAKKAANENLTATVDFEDVGFSIFKNFPQMTISLEGLTVKGQETFDGITLAELTSFDMAVDLLSLLPANAPIKVRSISLVEPNIHVLVTKDGKANYDITKPSTAEDNAEKEDDSSGPTSFNLSVESYSIKGGNLLYEDKAGDILARIKNLNHSGKGHFTEVIYDLSTQTEADALTVEMGDVSYLRKVALDADATFNIDTENSKYTLAENDIVMNSLQLLIDGFVQMKGDDIIMDLKLNAPNATIKNIISMVPNAYTKDYDDVKADGNASLSGFVKGTFNESQYPAFNFKTKIDNGNIQYPSLPLGIKDLNTNIDLKFAGGNNLDKLLLNVPMFSVVLGQDPFKASLLLKTPISDPDVKASVNGKVDLSNLSKAFPMESVESLQGILAANFSIDSKMSAIENEKYADVDMSGNMNLQGFVYKSTSLPTTTIDNLKLNFSPKYVAVDEFKAKVGQSDFVAQGRVDNILAYISPDQTMKGIFSMKSKYLNVNELMATAEGETNESENEAIEEVESDPNEKVFDAFDFTMDVSIEEMDYDIYNLKNNFAKGHFTPSSFKLEKFTTLIDDKNDLKASGEVTNVFPYLFDDEKLGGEIYVSSKFFNLNDFMTIEESDEPVAKQTASADEDIEPFEVPENIDMTIHANMKKVIYDDMNLSNLKGDVIVANQKAALSDVKANTLGGEISIDGQYDSNNKEKPGFDLDFGLEDIDIRKAFEQFNTFQKLAPIAEFMSGSFSTNMKMDGLLGKDMMPDLTSLNASGIFETVNALVKGYKPLSAVGKKLNVGYFDNLKLENTKNKFTVENGTITVKPFDTRVNNIPLNIQGTHTLTNEMNYVLKTAIPIDKLGSDVGKLSNQGTDFLSKQASKLGISIDQIQNIKLAINIKGTASNPKISITPLGSEGGQTSTKEVIKNVVEEAKTKVKEEVKAKIEDKKDDAKEKMDAEIKKIQDDYAKRIAKLQKEGDNKVDQLKMEGYKAADDLVKKAGNNIFKKKAAEVAAKEMKKKTDKEAVKLKTKWSDKINLLNKEADKKVDAVKKKYGKL